MHEWVEKALALQDKDIRIAKLEDQIKSVPLEKQKAQAMLGEADARLAAAKKFLQDEQKAIKSLEIEVEDLNQKRRDFEAKSTMIKDNTEYRAAMHQIETCRAKVQGLEDKELVLMEALERAREDLAREKQLHDATAQRVEQMIADLDTRQKNCGAQLEKLYADRQELAAGIPQAVVGKYKRILANRRGNGQEPLVFAPIRGYNCGYCHMNIPPQVRMDAIKGQITTCPQCGVLLYSEE